MSGKLLFVAHDDTVLAPLAASLARQRGLTASSAGIARGEMDALWRDLIADCGVDLSTHCPRPINGIDFSAVGCVVLLDEWARAECPTLPAHVTRLERPLPFEPSLDPVSIGTMVEWCLYVLGEITISPDHAAPDSDR